VPANYKVLFMQGGAIGENAIVPMNMLRGKPGADYVDTGEWSKKSIKEAKKYGQVNVAASAPASGYTTIPPRASWKLDPERGLRAHLQQRDHRRREYHFTPDVGSVPLVADMSSDILSRPVDVSKYGLIYGGAQKNIGPAGLTIVIVRDDLLGQALPFTPDAFDYKLQADNDSMYNTPPTYAIYIAGLVFKWIKAQGGLAAMEAHNRAKAALLYDYLDSTGFYRSPVARDCRSLMNVPFKLKDEALDAAFLKGARPRHGAAEGPPLGGRHARVDLQRDADRGRAGAGGLHEGLRGATWLSA
jgi:phosphoserine aminotransferase